MSESIFPPVEITCDSSGAFADDLVTFSNTHCDMCLIPGELLSFPNIEKQDGLEFVQARVIPFSDSMNDEEHGEDNDTAICITVHVDSNSTDMIKDNVVTEDLRKKLSKWLTTNNSDHMKMLSCQISGISDSYCIVSVTVCCEYYGVSHLLGNIIQSPFLDDVWNKYMDSIITEGVCYVHSKIPVTLRDSLRSGIDELAKKTGVDFHPNSNEIIRDLVHPALYPYIKGVSATVQHFITPVSSNEVSDFWGRPYEDSRYQWLPAPFQVSANEECTIQEYVNNLDRSMFPQLYKDLERLFEVFLPYFEEVWSYAQAITLFRGEDFDLDEDSEISPFKKEVVSFKDRELQVITKIVEYNLKPGQSYEGVWHAEGMSHENIVMTGIYFLDRDNDITGGDLRFKRAFTVSERNKVFWSVPQDRPALVNEAAEDGFLPLGRFPTKEGYLLVFPNCHIHKIAKMMNTSNSKMSSRRIIVFFFVNPEKKIISTREVPPQQQVISLMDARAHRLELMAERKYDKEKLNVRDIELCEH